ncbi:hypothetical protein Tco_1482368, partial [Tanacetum coccineum]
MGMKERLRRWNVGAKDLEQKRFKEEGCKEHPKKEVNKGTCYGRCDRAGYEEEKTVDQVSRSPDGDYLVIYRANGNFRAFNYLMKLLHIFDKKDLFHLYDLVLEQYSEIRLEGIELILWGDLKIMMESSTEENEQSDFWSDQQDWKIVSWRLYEACGVYILELEDGIVIHMLVERRYPLSKDLLQRMLGFGYGSLERKVFNSPCFMVKSWLVQDQTVLALASPKANELTIPEQTATGKGTSNPFMAGCRDLFSLGLSWSSYTSTVKSSKAKNACEEPNKNPDLKTDEKPIDKEDQEFAKDTKDLLLQAGATKACSTNTVNTASTPVSTASPYGELSITELTNTDQDDSEIPALEDIYD